MKYNFLKLGQFLTTMKVSPKEWGYKINKDTSVELAFPKCPLGDGCRMAYDQNLLKRPDGGLRCGVTNFVCGYLGLSTAYIWDYRFLERSESHCIVKCFIL
jgi:hypothetical protein